MSLTEFYSNRQQQLSWAPLQPLWKPFAEKRKRVSSGELRLSEADFLDWFATTLPELENFCQPAFEDMWANLFWYTGDYLPSMPLVIRTDAGTELRIPRQLAPLAVNYVNFLTNKRVAELSIYKPNHDTIPNEETSGTDSMTARTMKKVIEYGKRLNALPDLFNETEKENMIHGSVYAAIDWNPRKGDRKGKNSQEHEGETEVLLRHGWHVLPWRCRSWALAPLIVEIKEILHVDEARERYKDQSIEPFESRSLYSFQSPFIESVGPDETVIYRTCYRPDDFLPYGAVIEHTKEQVLSMQTDVYPWSHNGFPLERYTDIDIPSRFFPMSFYQNIKPLQHTYNNLSGLIKRYIATVAHPKIIHERGSVNIKALGNSPSLIGVKPSARFQPQIMQIRSIGADPFNFRNTLKDEMVTFSDTHKVGLGELPPNTRAGIMISRLREIENQQRGPQIDKRNGFMQRVLVKMGSVMADHLPLTSKKHIQRIVGVDMVQDVKNLANVKVSDEYKCLIVNPTGFSPEMTGRVQEIAAIEGEAKLPMTPMEKRDILGGVLREKYYDVLSAAKITAETEIEMMDNGIRPQPPRITDDLITHWTVLSINMQTVAHRRLPKKIRQIKEDHLEQIEMLISEVIKKNPSGLFAEKAKLLDGYPRLYNLEVEPEDQGGAGATPDAGSQAAIQAKAQASMLAPPQPQGQNLPQPPQG